MIFPVFSPKKNPGYSSVTPAKEVVVMRKNRLTEEHIIGILKQAEAGVSVVELCRQNANADATFNYCRRALRWPVRSDGFRHAPGLARALADLPAPSPLRPDTTKLRSWCSLLKKSHLAQ